MDHELPGFKWVQIPQGYRDLCAPEVLPDDVGLGHPEHRAVQVQLRVVARTRAHGWLQ